MYSYLVLTVVLVSQYLLFSLIDMTCIYSTDHHTSMHMLACIMTLLYVFIGVIIPREL